MRPLPLAFRTIVVWQLTACFNGPAASARIDQNARIDLRCFSAADQDQIHDCGCSLKVITLQCGPTHDTGWEAHFFSSLNDGAPLWIKRGGRLVSLGSHRPETNTFSYSRGDKWEEEYSDETVSVRIQYRPATSTCPAEKEREDGCEYFDVAANVFVTAAGNKPRKLKAVGSCGC